MIETLIMGLFEQTIKRAVLENGEDDGVSKVLYLDGMNSVMNLEDMYTDVLAAYVGIDGMLSFLVSDGSDNSQTFCSFYDLPQEVGKKIIEKVVGFHALA